MSIEEIPEEVLKDYQNRTITGVRNPRWDNAEHTMFTVEIISVELEALGYRDFTVTANADTAHGKQIWSEVLAGQYGEIAEYVEPLPAPTVIIIPAVTLWERMTEAEAEQVAEVMTTQPFRTRKIFETAATFRSDHELWPLLEQIANQLFGSERASELLAA